MLDINLIRQNPDKVKKGITSKNFNPSLVDDFLILDEEWKKLVKNTDDLRAEQKKLSTERKIEEAKNLKSKIQGLEEKIKIIEPDRNALINKFPNLPSEDALIGKDENENKILREAGVKPEFNFKIRDYLEISKELDLIDIGKASAVAGSRFGYIKNEAVILEFALVRFALDNLIPEGFIPVIPPVMIRPEVFEGMGRLAGNQEEERYYLPKDNLYLIGSSEHTMGPIHMDDVLNKKDLPKRYVAFSTCFRREAGSYGKDTRGILRVHQFDKVEMFSFSHPEESEKEHKFLLSIQEKIMSDLRLPYRVVEICAGDMGFTDAKQYDIETWIPSENKYRETHSCSNTTDFQARGINAKYKDGKTNETKFLHMLNATGFAIGRTLIAIIENYQQEDGSILIPEVLKKYTGFEKIWKKKV